MKLKNQIDQKVVDTTTGEVIEVTTQKIYSIKVNSDKFFMTFIEMIAPVYKLKSLSDLKLMIKFCEIAEYNTGKVNISSSLRKEICQQLEMSTNSFSISLKSLKDKRLITGDKGTYIINPEIYWKGTIDVRSSMMKNLKISFDIE